MIGVSERESATEYNDYKAKKNVSNNVNTNRLEKFMGMAFELAEEALERREVPVGCVIVLTKETGEDIVIAKGSNETNEYLNATRHAEIVAIDSLVKSIAGDSTQIKNTLSKCELFVTCEPCIMCADALNIVGIRAVYFGCWNERFGGCGTVEKINKNYICKGGIDADKGIELFQRFYSRKNPSVVPSDDARISS